MQQLFWHPTLRRYVALDLCLSCDVCKRNSPKNFEECPRLLQLKSDFVQFGEVKLLNGQLQPACCCDSVIIAYFPICGGGCGASKTLMSLEQKYQTQIESLKQSKLVLQQEMQAAETAKEQAIIKVAELEDAKLSIERALHAEERAKAHALEVAATSHEKIATEKAKVAAIESAKYDLDMKKKKLETELSDLRQISENTVEQLKEELSKIETEKKIAEEEVGKAMDAVGEIAARAAALQSLSDQMTAERRSTLIHKETAERIRDTAVRKCLKEAEAAKEEALSKLKKELEEVHRANCITIRDEYRQRREFVEQNWERERKAVYSVLSALPDSDRILVAIDEALNEARSQNVAVPEDDPLIPEEAKNNAPNGDTVESDMNSENDDDKSDDFSEKDDSSGDNAGETDENHGDEDGFEDGFDDEDSSEMAGDPHRRLIHEVPSLLDLIKPSAAGSNAATLVVEAGAQTVKAAAIALQAAMQSGSNTSLAFDFWAKEHFLHLAGNLRRTPLRDMAPTVVQQVLKGQLSNKARLPRDVVRTYMSSCFWDTEVERNQLKRCVFPFLRELCAILGKEWQVIDARWGIHEWVVDDHCTAELCFSEIKRCGRLAAGPAFVSLLGNSYGWRPIPKSISAKNFEKMLAFCKRKLREEMGLLLEDWYLLDTNFKPPKYVLQPISSKLAEFLHPEAGPFLRASEEWASIFEQIQGMLQLAGESCLGKEDSERMHASFIDFELQEGGLANPKRNEQTFVFCRTFSGWNQHSANDDEAATYFDITGRADDKVFIDDASKALESLKKDVSSRLRDKHIVEVTLPWIPGGIRMTNAEHKMYLETFCATFAHSLAGAVLNYHEQYFESSDPLVSEVATHHEHARNLQKNFVGRDTEVKKVMSYIINLDIKKPLVIFGPGGIGKSMLMTASAFQATVIKPSATLVFRCIGKTARSLGLSTFLSDICGQINRNYGVPETSPKDAVALVPSAEEGWTKTMQRMLSKARLDRPLFLWLDEIDVLFKEAGPNALSWIPATLPPFVKIVLSICSESEECLESIRKQMSVANIADSERFVEVSPFPSSDAEVLAEQYLNKTERKLTPSQLQSIMNGFGFQQLPLYLILALRASHAWNSFTKEPSWGVSIEDLVMSLLYGAEAKHGYIFVSHAIAYLACARRGLTTPELEDILSLDDEVLAEVHHRSTPPARRFQLFFWMRLAEDISPLLTQSSFHNTFMTRWIHDCVSTTARSRYTANSAIRSQRHQLMSEYFGNVWHSKPKPYLLPGHTEDSDFVVLSSASADRFVSSQPLVISGAIGSPEAILNSRRLDEHLYHVDRSGDFLETIRCRLDPEYLEVMCCMGKMENLIGDLHDIAEGKGPLFSQQGRKNCRHESIAALSQKSRKLHRFFLQHKESLFGNPRLLLQSFLNSPTDSTGTQMLKMCEESFRPAGPYLHCTQRPMGPDVSIMRLVIEHGIPGEKITTFSISQGDNFVFAATEAMRLCLWNLRTGGCKQIHVFDRGTRICQSAYSPDGARVAIGFTDGTIQIWNVLESTFVALLKKHSSPIACMCFSKDGNVLVSGSVGGEAALVAWDAPHPAPTSATGVTPTVTIPAASATNANSEWKARVLEGASTVSSITTYSDGTMLYCHGNGKFVHANLLSGSIIAQRIIKENMAAHAVFPKTPRILHSGSSELFESLMKTPPQTEQQQQLSKKIVACSTQLSLGDICVAISPQEDLAARGCKDIVELISLHQGTILSKISEPICSLAVFSPTGKILVTSSSYGVSTQLWSVPDMLKLGSHLGRRGGIPQISHDDRVVAVAFSSDSKLAISGSDDCSVRIWDCATGASLNLLQEHSSKVTSFAFSHDSTTLATASEDGSVKIWSTSTFDFVGTLSGMQGRPFSIALSPCGQYCAAGTSKKMLHLWSKVDMTEIFSTSEGHLDSVKLVGFSPNGNFVYSVSDDTFRLWTTTSPAQILIEVPYIKYYRELTRETLRVVFSPNCKSLVTLSSSERYSSRHDVSFWDIETGSLQVTFEGIQVEPHGWWIAISPRADVAVARSKVPCALGIFSLEDGWEKLRLKGHENHITVVAFSPEGVLMVSGSSDRTARVWDTKTGQCLHCISGHESTVTNVAITITGGRKQCKVVTATWWEHVVRIWECASQPLESNNNSDDKAPNDSNLRAEDDFDEDEAPHHHHHHHKTQPAANGIDKDIEPSMTMMETPCLISKIGDEKALEAAGIHSAFGNCNEVIKVVRYQQGLMVTLADSGLRLMDLSESVNPKMTCHAVSANARSIIVGDIVGGVKIYTLAGIPCPSHCLDRTRECA